MVVLMVILACLLAVWLPILITLLVRCPFIIMTAGMLTSLELPNPIFGEMLWWLLSSICMLSVLRLVVSCLVVLKGVLLPFAVITRMLVGVILWG